MQPIWKEKPSHFWVVFGIGARWYQQSEVHQGVTRKVPPLTNRSCWDVFFGHHPVLKRHELVARNRYKNPRFCGQNQRFLSTSQIPVLSSHRFCRSQKAPHPLRQATWATCLPQMMPGCLKSRAWAWTGLNRIEENWTGVWEFSWPNVETQPVPSAPGVNFWIQLPS